MSPTKLVCVATFAILSTAGAARAGAPPIRFGFDAPEFLAGSPGETVTFEAYATIESDSADVRGWSMSMTSDGGAIADISLDGMRADTTTGPLPLDESCRDCGFLLAETASDPDNPEIEGAVLAIVLALTESRFLLPGASQRVARLEIETTFPEDEDCRDIELRYLSGLQGRGRPVLNVVTVGRGTPESRVPSTTGASTSLTCSLPWLPLDEDVAARLDASNPDRRYRLRAPLGSTVRITARDTNSSHANELYMRWDGVPEPGNFHRAARRPRGANQTLIEPYFRDETGYVLLAAAVGGMGEAGNDVTLRADVLGRELLSVTPSSTTPRAGDRPVSISGAGFTRDTRFEFADPGSELSIPVLEQVVVSSTRAQALLDLSSAPAGSYDATARWAGESSTLPGAFVIAARSLGPILRIDLETSETYRLGDVAALSLVYENTGETAVRAPIVLIEGPVMSEIRFADEDGFRGDSLQVACLNPDGPADLLPPGASGRVELAYRIPFHEGFASDGEFRLHELTPTPGRIIDWNVVTPLTKSGWDELRPRLWSEWPYWTRYESALLLAARRLSLHCELQTDVLELLRFATRELLERPTARASGQLRDASGTPLAGVTVVALESGAPRSFAVTDDDGCFSIDWLAAGVEYELGVVNHAIDPPLGSFESATGEDVFLGAVFARFEKNAIQALAPNVDEAGLPAAPLLPPEGELASVFADRGSLEIDVISSWDPNEKNGPAGEGDGGLVPKSKPLRYTIHFENDPELATAAARDVRLEDRLSKHLDPATFTPLDVTIGQGVTAGLQNFVLSGFGDDSSLAVRVTTTLSLEPITDPAEMAATPDAGPYVARWLFETIDPQTQATPTDAAAGFLPVAGTGSVTFTATPGDAVLESTELKNSATITFDANPSIVTNEVVNRLTSVLPSQVRLVPTPADGAEIDIDTVPSIEPVIGAESYEFTLLVNDNAIDSSVGPAASFPLSEELSYSTEYTWSASVLLVNGESVLRSWSFSTIDEPTSLLPGEVSSPEPEDGATNVPLDTTVVRWAAPVRADFYAVRVWKAGEAPPSPEATLATEFAVTLEAETDYLWQVGAFNQNGPTTGPVWSFSTRPPRANFLRGDTDESGDLQIVDGIRILNILFFGTDPIACQEAMDSNGDSLVNINDAVWVFNFLFLGGPPPPAPYPDCGPDPDEPGSPGDLGCETFVGCPR